jgi:hypothetical protein
VDDGDQRRDRIGPEASAVVKGGGSRTALTVCNDSVDLIWMDVELREAMKRPLGLAARCVEAGQSTMSAIGCIGSWWPQSGFACLDSHTADGMGEVSHLKVGEQCICVILDPRWREERPAGESPCALWPGRELSSKLTEQKRARWVSCRRHLHVYCEVRLCTSRWFDRRSAPR